MPCVCPVMCVRIGRVLLQVDIIQQTKPVVFLCVFLSWYISLLTFNFFSSMPSDRLGGTSLKIVLDGKLNSVSWRWSDKLMQCCSSEAYTLHVAAAGSDDAEVDGVCRWSRQATHHVRWFQLQARQCAVPADGWRTFEWLEFHRPAGNPHCWLGRQPGDSLTAAVSSFLIHNTCIVQSLSLIHISEPTRPY